MGQKRAIVAFVVLIVFSSIFVTVNASEIIQIPARGELTITIDLDGRDRVEVSLFDIGHGRVIDFYVTDPRGEIILRRDGTLYAHFSFIANETGTFAMHFRNDWLVAVPYALDYSITEAGEREPVFSSYTLCIIVTIVASSLAVILAVLAFRRNKRARVRYCMQTSLKVSFAQFLHGEGD